MGEADGDVPTRYDTYQTFTPQKRYKIRSNRGLSLKTLTSLLGVMGGNFMQG